MTDDISPLMPQKNDLHYLSYSDLVLNVNKRTNG